MLLNNKHLLKYGDIIHVNLIDDQKLFVLAGVNKSGSIEINRYGLCLAESLSGVGNLNE